MTILSLDSGIERCGYAVFKKNKSDSTLLSYGLISTSKSESLENRLFKLRDEFETLLTQFTPKTVVMESLFFNTNQKTMKMVAQSQGALLASCGARNIIVEFLTPLVIKEITTGYGRADKKSVEKMIMMVLNLKTAPKPDDVVDAIACGYAYCCLNKFT